MTKLTNAHIAYAALWAMDTHDGRLHMARHALLEELGGKGSPQQRQAIEWANANLVVCSHEGDEKWEEPGETVGIINRRNNFGVGFGKIDPEAPTKWPDELLDAFPVRSSLTEGNEP